MGEEGKAEQRGEEKKKGARREGNGQAYIREWTVVKNRSVINKNKAGYTATEVVCGWAGAIFEVTRPFGQEQ